MSDGLSVVLTSDAVMKQWANIALSLANDWPVRKIFTSRRKQEFSRLLNLCFTRRSIFKDSKTSGKALNQCFNDLTTFVHYLSIVSEEEPSNLRPDITKVNGALPRQAEE